MSYDSDSEDEYVVIGAKGNDVDLVIFYDKYAVNEIAPYDEGKSLPCFVKMEIKYFIL